MALASRANILLADARTPACLGALRHGVAKYPKVREVMSAKGGERIKPSPTVDAEPSNERPHRSSRIDSRNWEEKQNVAAHPLIFACRSYPFAPVMRSERLRMMASIADGFLRNSNRVYGPKCAALGHSRSAEAAG